MASPLHDSAGMSISRTSSTDQTTRRPVDDATTPPRDLGAQRNVQPHRDSQLTATDGFERSEATNRETPSIYRIAAAADNSLMHDGYYGGGPVSPDGVPQFYDPNTTSIDSIPAITPEGAEPNGATLYFINGIDTSPWLARDGAQRLANESGAQVRMIYNARRDVGSDILQSARDLYGPADGNPASATLGNMLYHKLKADQRVHLVGESQGAIIVRNGLELAAQRLRDDGMSADEVKERLGNVVVETYNGAVPGPPVPREIGGGTLFRRRGFIDGPTYIHYGNPRDEAVFARMGVGQWGGARFAGEGAVIRKISEGQRSRPIEAHLFRNIIDERVPWDQAVREGNVDIVKD